MSARLRGSYFLAFAFIGVVTPYLSLYLHGIGASARDIAVLVAVMQSLRMAGPYLWGVAADRGSPYRQTIGLTILGTLGGLSAFMTADTFAGRLWGMIVLSLFWSGTLPLLEALTFSHLAQCEVCYGSTRLWGSVGFVVAVLAAGQLIDAYSVLVVPRVGVPILLGLLALSCVLPKPASPARPAATAALRPLATILAAPAVAATLAAGFMMSAAHGAFNLFYSIHLSQHGYSAFAIGLLWGLGIAAEIGVLMAMPRLHPLFAPRIMLMACFAAAGIRFVLVGWGTAWVAVAAAAQLLHALSFGAHHALSVAVVNRRFGAENSARGQALYASCYGAGALVGGLAAGLLWLPLGGAWTFTVSSALALAGMVAIMRYMGDET